MDRARLGRTVVLVGLAGLLGAGAVAPRQTGAVLGSLWRRADRWLRDVPEPVIVAAALLAVVVLWFLVVRWLLGLCYRLGRALSARVYRVLTLVLPESPLVKFAAGAMVMIFAVIVIVGALPALLGGLSDADDGPSSYANLLSDAAINNPWGEIVDGDAVPGEPGCGEAGSGGTTDRDGDGLPDAWERAGETPDGAALPGADPDRKDLYVQVNYGSDVEALSSAEKAQLEAVWARMPVDNPDGSEGIDLHLDAESTGAGRLPEPAAFTDRDERDRYADRLGPRRCVYHQVVYGKVELGPLVGAASTPGYTAAVDGSRQPGYTGDVSFRVALTTHQLLHNVAGPVDGGPHTNAGWLVGGPTNEFLSGATARKLETVGLFGPAS